MKAQTILLEQTEPGPPFVQSREQFESILLQLASAATCQMTHSEVEKLVSTDGTELMRRLLQEHLSLRARQEQEQGLSGPVRGVDQVPRVPAVHLPRVHVNLHSLVPAVVTLGKGPEFLCPLVLPQDTSASTPLGTLVSTFRGWPCRFGTDASAMLDSTYVVS